MILKMSKEDLSIISPDFEDKVLNASDPNDLKDLTQLFNFNQAKKNLLRLQKLSILNDGVVSKIERRLLERPDDFSNRELLDYLQVINSVLDKQSKSQDDVLDKPMITYQQNNQVNVNIANDLTRESRDKITNLISEILNAGNLENLQILENIEENNGEE